VTRIADTSFTRIPNPAASLAEAGTAPAADTPLALFGSSLRTIGAGPRRTMSTPSAAPLDPLMRSERSAQTESLQALAIAFSGNPDLLLARVALEMRRSRSAVQETGLRVEASSADSAEKAREAAEAAAKRAAETATSFLGLGKTFDVVVKVASVVAAVAATALSAGAAGPLAAGMLLMSFGADLADLAVSAGLCPPEMRDAVATALKLTGAVLVATVSLGAGSAAVASVALEATSAQVVDAAAEAFDMSPAARLAVQTTLSVGAGVLAGVAGGAAASAAAGSASADRALRATLEAGREVARGVALAATLGSAGADVGVAVAEREGALARIDASAAEQARDASHSDADAYVEGLRSTLRAYGRAMRLARQTQEARGEALRAATRQLA
jgi:hypothetical protein